MVKAAEVMPTDWIIKEKSRATVAGILKISVNTGKATDPPPGEIIIFRNGEAIMSSLT